ncbi:phage protein NinX family protein [Serratia sp. IR-2025]
MTDYSKMSDFEINCLVAEMIGYLPLDAELGYAGSQEEGDITAAIVRGKNRIGAFSPCDNPSDAWPIIEQNYISLTFDGISWDASSPLKEITYNAWKTHPYQPLRLAMIVFLMMKDAEKC